MHKAEEVRHLIAIMGGDPATTIPAASKMLLSYAALLEAMEEANRNGAPYMVSPIAILRASAAEKQKARKG